ncbi:MAG: hypothetical protein JWO03_3754 [Bacteroidetes bacterium]|nr:hypothetical protein [Bacteroidota bacterium]
MKTILLFILFLTIADTGSKHSMQQIAGKYVFKGEDYSIRLTLHKDSTCDYYAGNGETGVLCDGKWRILSSDSVEIICDGEQPQNEQVALENALAGLIPGQKRFF